MYDTLVKPGMLEMYCGPMKCGKTFTLIQRVEKLKYMEDVKYQLFKPAADTRDSNIKTRFNGLEEVCHSVKKPEEILGLIEPGCVVVGIDEAQFFSKKLVEVVEKLLSQDMNVIGAGLDLDFKGEPFGPMPELLAMADYVEKLIAVCQYPRCRRRATRTQRLLNGKPAHYDSPLIVVEGSGEEVYQARCLKHHEVPGKEKF